jgi:hypothetical protein
MAIYPTRSHALDAHKDAILALCQELLGSCGGHASARATAPASQLHTRRRSWPVPLRAGAHAGIARPVPINTAAAQPPPLTAVGGAQRSGDTIAAASHAVYRELGASPSAEPAAVKPRRSRACQGSAVRLRVSAPLRVGDGRGRLSSVRRSGARSRDGQRARRHAAWRWMPVRGWTRLTTALAAWPSARNRRVGRA